MMARLMRKHPNRTMFVGIHRRSSTRMVSFTNPADRGGGNIEPVTFNSMSVAFWRDQMKAMKCDACYDITPLDGCLMLACIELKLFYVGVCFTEHHATELRAWMIKQILKRTSPARSFRVRSSIAHPPDDVPTHKQHTHTCTHTSRPTGG